MKLPEPNHRTFSTLMSDIEKGLIKIPQFQREFVWDLKKSSKLLDSIIKGYPIGTFIFWKTNERLRSVRNLGHLNLPSPPEGEYVDYVLDGQQRMTSLFASLKGLKIIRSDGKEEDFNGIYVDLKAAEDEDIILTDVSNIPTNQIIQLKDLLYGSLSKLNSYDQAFHSRIDDYRTRINSYSYSIISIREAPIDIATEIFTRINEGGKPLTVFEIMVAKTFDVKLNFDLAEKYKKLIDNLTIVDYETISDVTILQTIATILKKECNRKVILKLDKKQFIQVWEEAVNAIESAVEFFRNSYRIPVSNLLPYNALVVPFAYFFYHNKKKPTGDKQRYLEDFFWRVSLGTRYSFAVESKLAQDIKRIDKILEGKQPDYDWGIDSSREFIEHNGRFSAGRSYIKAFLCILAFKQPKSFNDDSLVNISNAWLKQANSKNYHHFFPKGYFKKNGVYTIDMSYINHIFNITIVDDFLNKREIKAKAPSVYMKKFAKENPNLARTMKSHLINDLDKFGIWDNDYDAFLENRGNLFSKEVKRRIIPIAADKSTNLQLADDYEGDDEILESEY